MKLPYNSTVKKIEKMFGCLTQCTPEIAVSVMTMIGLGYESEDKLTSEGHYLRAISILHRTYADPRARDNLFHQWETFVVARLLNIKRSTGKDY